MSTGKLFASLGCQAVCCGFYLSLGVGSIGVGICYLSCGSIPAKDCAEAEQKAVLQFRSLIVAIVVF